MWGFPASFRNAPHVVVQCLFMTLHAYLEFCLERWEHFKASLITTVIHLCISSPELSSMFESLGYLDHKDDFDLEDPNERLWMSAEGLQNVCDQGATYTSQSVGSWSSIYCRRNLIWSMNALPMYLLCETHRQSPIVVSGGSLPLR